MRLLRTDIYNKGRIKLVLEEFSGGSSQHLAQYQGKDADSNVPRLATQNAAQRTPPYAILSHTWGNGEVLFSDIDRDAVSAQEGFQKIRYTTDQARRDGYDYVWIDTCCINKNSSAELSEAINSMYAWYQGAARCYAYLADVPANVDTAAQNAEFARCRWFTRGWCLQELLAPTDLVFYSSQWDLIGDKEYLRDSILKITNIDVDILIGARPLESASVAKRMSWAAFRQTTRVEDLAYCLMGLFSVNMPMLYGEGSKAFHRLQEEIMKHSDDQSIFAWSDPDAPTDGYHGLLADSPAAFARSGDMFGYDDWEERSPYDMTNRGLRIDFHLTRCGPDLYAAALNCPTISNYEGFLAIFLKRLATGDRQFARVKCQSFGALDSRGSLETVFVRQPPRTADVGAVYPAHFFQLRRHATAAAYALLDAQYARAQPEEPQIWQTLAAAQGWVPAGVPRSFKIRKGAGRLTAALLFRRRADGATLVVMLGSTTDLSVGFDVMERAGDALESLERIEARFDPWPPWTPLVMESHRVRVDVQPYVKSGAKVYVVDIFIEAIEKEGPIAAIVETAKVLMEPEPIKNRRKIWQKIGLHRE